MQDHAIGKDSEFESGQTEIESPSENTTNGGITRRDFIRSAGLACTSPMVLPEFAPLEAPAQSPATTAALAPGTIEQVAVRLKVNDANYRMKLDARVTVLDLLRERLDLPGTKKGCNQGQCGACTVIVDGKRINSCLALAVCHDGASITTVEGLGRGDALHPVQAAFTKHDGFQCGYCTPGQICSAAAMLNEAKKNTASHVTPDARQTANIGGLPFPGARRHSAD